MIEEVQTQGFGGSQLESSPDRGTPQSLSRLSAGDLIDRYILIQCIGAGGMGEVFEGYDPDLSRKVALKFFLPPDTLDSTSPSARQLVERQRQALIDEARTLAKLEHPNIVRVYDIGTWEDRVYMAMELVPGQTLRTWTAQNRPPCKTVLNIYSQLADALAYVHQCGILHLDFKPDNVIIDRNGTPKLLDFGIASHKQSNRDKNNSQISHRKGHALKLEHGTEMARSVSGAQAGTPSYMAPEQMLGGELSSSCDQYAFFISLYESLFLQKPYHAPSRDLLLLEKQRFSLNFPKTRRRVPRRIIQVIRTGLEPNPKERHPGMRSVVFELRRKPVRHWTWTGICALTIFVAGHDLSGRLEAARQWDLTCNKELVPASEMWNPTRIAEIRDRYRQIENPYASSIFHTLRHEVNLRIENWKSISNRLCRQQDDQSSEPVASHLLAESDFCLQSCLQEIDSFIQSIEHPSQAKFEKIPMVAESLCKPQSCLEQNRDASNPLPQDFARRIEAIKIRKDLNNLISQSELHGTAIPEDMIETLHHRARQLNYPPLLAQVELLWIESQTYHGRPLELIRHGYQIIQAATRFNLEQTRIKALKILVIVYGIRLRETDHALELAHLAQGAEKRINQDSIALQSVSHETTAALGTAGRLKEAEIWAKRSIDKIRNIYENIESSNPRHAAAIEINFRRNNLAVTQYYRGDYDAAQRTLERQSVWLERIFPPGHKERMFPRSNYALVLNALGKYEEAVQFAMESINTGKALGVGWNEALIRARYVVADTDARERRFNKARQWIEESMEGRKAIDGNHSPFLIIERVKIAEILDAEGKHDAARNVAANAIGLWPEDPGSRGPIPDLFEAFLHLAQLYISWSNWPLAERCINTAKGWQPSHPELLEPRNALLWLTEAELFAFRDSNMERAQKRLRAALLAPGIREAERVRAIRLLNQIEKNDASGQLQLSRTAPVKVGFD